MPQRCCELDEGVVWPTAFMTKELTADMKLTANMKANITELTKKTKS